MKLILLASLVFFSNVAFGQSPRTDLELRSDYKLMSDPLTTEKVGLLDPTQLNPHRQSWVLSRHVEMFNLKTYIRPNIHKDSRTGPKFGVQVKELRSDTRGYVRGKGEWYQPFSEFPCTKEPNAWFGTEDGAKVAAGTAATVWAELLRDEKVKLLLLLERVSGDTETSATDEAELVFKNWLKKVEKLWRARAPKKARSDEWNFYLEAAESTRDCHPNTQPRAPSRRMMEINAGDPPPISKILARVPVRLWNGLFSVRLSVTMAGKTLNGRFLIDSELTESVMSPTWIVNQGIFPAWIKVPTAAPERVNFGFYQGPPGGLAQRVQVEKVEIGGLQLLLQDFLLFETEFFGPPENVGTCCDGVLGRDFLRLYPMEFDAHTPAEVRIWPRENFHWSSEVPWIEVDELSSGGVMSPCQVFPNSKPEYLKSRLSGVKWCTASEEALLIHQPWRQIAQQSLSKNWDIRCEGVAVATQVHATLPDLNTQGLAESFLSSKIPAVTVGMPLLSRGNFTFDLPHGRLWLSKEILAAGPPRANTSGLILEYIEKEGDRILRVAGITPKSRAKNLTQAGLKPGFEISKIDGKPSEELDQWEVDRRLAGDYGESVVLQWKTRNGLKMAPLQVRDSK